MDYSNYSFIILLVVFGVVMYFMIIRPQKKREKKQQELRSSIEVGDEVTTIGGIVGRVVNVKDDTFVLETAGDRSRMRFRRWAIQEVSKLSLEGDTDAAEKKEKKDTSSQEGSNIKPE